MNTSQKLIWCQAHTRQSMYWIVEFQAQEVIRPMSPPPIQRLLVVVVTVVLRLLSLALREIQKEEN